MNYTVYAEIHLPANLHSHFTCPHDSPHLRGLTPLPPFWEDPVVACSSFQGEGMEMHLVPLLLGGFLHLSTRTPSSAWVLSFYTQARDTVSWEEELRDVRESFVVTKYSDLLSSMVYPVINHMEAETM